MQIIGREFASPLAQLRDRRLMGRWRGCMPACDGSRPPFKRLQGLQAVMTFSQVVRPPLERGIT